MKKKNLLLCLACSCLLCGCGGNDKKEEETKTYTVTLNANGGTFESIKSETKTLSKCTTLAKADLEEPIKENAEFKGWYLDSGSSQTVTFPYTLSNDITIFAGYSDMPTGEFKHEENSYIKVNDLKDNVYTIDVTAPTNDDVPTITLSGCVNDAQLNFVFPKKYTGEVNVILNGFKITSTESLAPIIFPKADATVNITSNENTSNFIYDKRPSSEEFDDNGSISSKSNLKFNGTGYLYINDKSSYQGYSDAIYSSKNITIENTILKAYGVNNSIRGKKSITINDSTITAYSKTGLGLKTSDEDVYNNKRCGDININGNTSLTVATAQHGISAAHDLFINSNDKGTPKISVYTSDYASSYTTISTPTLDEKDMYIYMPTSIDEKYVDQSNYRFAVLFDGTTWDNARLKKIYTSSQPRLSSKNGGPQPEPQPQPTGGTAGYYFGLDRPNDAKKYQIVLFDSTRDDNPDITEEELEPGKNCVALSEELSFPSSGDTAKIKTLSGTSITCDTEFGTYDKMLDKSTNQDKANYGCKGMTAGNKLEINAGTISIKTKDDAIQSKYGKLYPADSTAGFEREVGQGILNVNGDNTKIYIASADDAMNAVTLNIGESGCPTISIETSREGLEASVINYKNGNTSLYAKDDGVNGSSNGNIPNSGISVNVSGGYLDVQVAEGDTDGIDSNNTYNQTGGVVISRASSNSDMSTGLDTDGKATISDQGIFIVLGAKAEAEKEGKLTYGKKNESSISFKQNTKYTINEKYSFTTALSYSKMITYLGNNATQPTVK